MKKMFLAFVAAVALLVPSLSSAQFAPTAAGARPAAVDAASVMPAGKIRINTATIMPRGFGINVPRVAAPSGQPGTIHDSPGGAFRIVCANSHEGFDDPIVWPGRPGMTHLHTFFGNTKTDSYTDAADMRAVGNSTCAGGSINKSGYWVPALVYHCPPTESGCNHARDGEVQHSVGNNVYYKSEGYTGPAVSQMIWPPPGLRMIAGDASSTAAMPAAGSGNIRVACLVERFTPGNPNGLGFVDHIPTTADVNVNGEGSCNQLEFLVYFPVCWDGVNLDSLPSHAAHLNDNADANGCHSPGYKLIPSISYNVSYSIKSNADFDFLRLSSDQPKADAKAKLGVWGCATAAKNWCAGASLHGDWANGWITDKISVPGLPGTYDIVQDAILGNCLRPQVYYYNSVPGWGLDCHDHNLGQLDRVANPGVEYWVY